MRDANIYLLFICDRPSQSEIDSCFCLTWKYENCENKNEDKKAPMTRINDKNDADISSNRINCQFFGLGRAMNSYCILYS